MIRFLLEKEFNVNEKEENFYVDAIDLHEKIMYRFIYDATETCIPIEIEIEPFKEISLSTCEFIEGDVDELFKRVSEIAPKQVKKLYDEYFEEVQEKEEEKKEEEQRIISEGILLS
jgi:hypothetical protein